MDSDNHHDSGTSILTVLLERRGTYKVIYDLYVYYNKLPGGKYIYLLLYVDNMLIASKSRSAIDKLKKDLSSEFEMKDLSETKKSARHGD